jgi:hypothetical protein
MQRIRIKHKHDLFKGHIGYVVEKIEQHSLYTYVVMFKNQCKGYRRAYQRSDFEFLSDVKSLPKSVFK